MSSTTDFLAVLTAEIGDDNNEEDENFVIEDSSVTVQIIRFLFIANTAFCFVVCIWGIIPYYLLRFDAPQLALIIILVITLVFFVLTYGLLFYYCEQPILLIVWMFFLFMLINVMAAILRSLSPFQAVAICFVQQLGVLGYCFVAKRSLTVIWTIVVTLIPALCMWLLGLYAFLQEQDWISSVVLLVIFVIGVSAYNTYEIYLIGQKRFHVKENIRVLSFYYTDSLRLPYEWWSSRRRRV
jgi:hypothetical protein